VNAVRKAGYQLNGDVWQASRVLPAPPKPPAGLGTRQLVS